MTPERNTTGFARFAQILVGYNVLVILWGVFLRASRSGDGCGQHWLTCHGEIVPSAPQLKTAIEFSHRLTSALAGILIIALLVWAIAQWRRNRSETSAFLLKGSIVAFILVIIEGALGAGLVLTGNTAENLTAARPFWMAGHLLNTLLLLASLTTVAWAATTRQTLSINLKSDHLRYVLICAAVFFAIGASGSIAALTNLIFPSASLQEGLAKDISPTSHTLLKLRPFHPIFAVAGSIFLVMFTGWIGKKFGTPSLERFRNILSFLLLIQLAFGAATLLTLSPILMQLGHLLLADLAWIAFVLFALTLLSAGNLDEKGS